MHGGLHSRKLTTVAILILGYQENLLAHCNVTFFQLHHCV